MKRLSTWLYEKSSGWITLIALLVFVIFSGLTLPGQSALAEQYSNGLGSPDTSLFYSPAMLNNLVEAYGVEGRQAYLHARWTFDLAFPFVYTLFLVTAISWVLKRVIPVDSKWRLLNLVPLLAMVLDLLENTAVSLVMTRYPVACPPGELLAPVFTPLKWSMVGGSFLILVYGLIALVILRIRK